MFLKVCLCNYWYVYIDCGYACRMESEYDFMPYILFVCLDSYIRIFHAGLGRGVLYCVRSGYNIYRTGC
jgi:hypothetical protein